MLILARPTTYTEKPFCWVRKNRDGFTWFKSYHIIHRYSGPAEIERDTGTALMFYRQDGLLHCLDGMAAVGGQYRETYFIRGVRYTKFKFDKTIKRAAKKGIKL